MFLSWAWRLSAAEEGQVELIIGWAELPRSPGDPFYDRLQAVLVEAGFDDFAAALGRTARTTARWSGLPTSPPEDRAKPDVSCSRKIQIVLATGTASPSRESQSSSGGRAGRTRPARRSKSSGSVAS